MYHHFFILVHAGTYFLWKVYACISFYVPVVQYRFVQLLTEIEKYMLGPYHSMVGRGTYRYVQVYTSLLVCQGVRIPDGWVIWIMMVSKCKLIDEIVKMNVWSWRIICFESFELQTAKLITNNCKRRNNQPTQVMCIWSIWWHPLHWPGRSKSCWAPAFDSKHQQCGRS
jgi:hypothetical protein